LEEVAGAAAASGSPSLDDLFIHPRKLLPQFPCDLEPQMVSFDLAILDSAWSHPV
jgi:hypothetical protein